MCYFGPFKKYYSSVQGVGLIMSNDLKQNYKIENYKTKTYKAK